MREKQHSVLVVVTNCGLLHCVDQNQSHDDDNDN
jgi:hypothetical protein